MKTIYLKVEVPDDYKDLHVMTTDSHNESDFCRVAEIHLPTDEIGIEADRVYPFTDSQYVNNEQKILRKAFSNGAKWMLKHITG